MDRAIALIGGLVCAILTVSSTAASAPATPLPATPLPATLLPAIVPPVSPALSTPLPAISRGRTWPGRAPGEPYEAAFGFRVGEERRYTLEPPEVLEPGEEELWIMRLESIKPAAGEATHDAFRAVFTLVHESLRYRGGNIFNPDERVGATTTTRLVVNQYGFPLEVRLEVEQTDTAGPYSQRQVALTFQNNGYLVENPRSMTFREFNVPVPKSDRVDRDLPRGVYLDRAINPGLESLVFATLYDGDDVEMKYMVLNPTSMARRNYRRNDPFGAARPGMPGRTRLRAGAPDPLRARSMRVKERTFVEVGGREVAALKVDTDLSRGNLWMSPDGTVLRIDTRADRRDAWIRLLHPSEY